CPDAAALTSLVGEIITEFDEGVENVEVQLLNDGEVARTGRDGSYNFDYLIVGETMELDPKLDIDHLNGVSTFDLVLMQKHILGYDELDSPYKLIAADINRSGSITAIDIVEARRLILGYYDNFPDNESWRFVPEGYNFADPSRPFDFPEVLEIGLQEGASVDFTGIKIGDVNESNTPHSLMSSTIRSVGTLTFSIDDREVQVGEEVMIEVRSEDFADVAGYQFTLEAAGMELTGIQAGALPVDESHFGIFDGYLTTSFNRIDVGQASEEALFTLTFRSEVSARLSEVLRISSRITRAEAYRSGGDHLDIALTFDDPNPRPDTRDPQLLQNRPNPFDQKTTIGFYLPEQTKAVLTIHDVAGKVIKRIEGEYVAGYHQLEVSKTEIQAVGVLYYTLETDEFRATKKMVVLE
ncbi:MAG: T9SS type A sorting domain-containing protein, partial [Saprospiraceae bacterium]|nr:T9SS type A sorting domain-containing protein [Saprospiraceae bacterium]